MLNKRKKGSQRGSILVAMFREPDCYAVYPILEEGASRASMCSILPRDFKNCDERRMVSSEECKVKRENRHNGRSIRSRLSRQPGSESSTGNIDPLIGRD
jgi:hypothetical protein